MYENKYAYCLLMTQRPNVVCLCYDVWTLCVYFTRQCFWCVFYS